MAARTRTLKISTEDGTYECAVNPRQIQVTGEAATKNMELLNVGTVALPGNRGPVKCTLSFFLPGPPSPFYKGIPPERVINWLKKAKNGKRSVRILLSGTDLNHSFLISSQSETYIEGTQDVTISLSLIEDRRNTVNAVASLTGAAAGNGLLERTGSPEVPKSHLIKSGDTLWALAKRYYGDGSKWKQIAQANGISNERALRIGSTLEIPK